MIRWLWPAECDPPHQVTDWGRFDALRQDILAHGWRVSEPVLLGYPFDERVQLISGSHRWAVCAELQRKLPVFLLDYSDVWQMWGTDEWLEMMTNPPLLAFLDVGEQ